MPYKVRKVKGGFKVVDPNSSHIFSKQPLTKTQARKQQIALALSESRKTGKPVKNYFI
jgi:hypothetical protein